MRHASIGLATGCCFLFGTVCARAIDSAVTVDIRNPTGATLRDVPVTFGQVFKRGDISESESVVVQYHGQRVPAQVDVKRHHAGGSVRFAVISLIVDELPANERRTLSLGAGRERDRSGDAVALNRLLETDFNAEVTLRFPEGVVRQISARELLAGNERTAKTWLRGPVVTEWLVSGPPRDAAGKPDDDLNVQFHVRAYAGCKSVRVSVVVENCWDHWAGNIGYDVSVKIGNDVRFTERAVDHRRLSRWRKVFWWGEKVPEVHVVHDLAALSASGALPKYDTTLPTEQTTSSHEKLLDMEGDAWRIMGRGPLTAYMPTTGGRPEIAPYPEWAARCLLTMDPRWKSLVLAAGDLAGSWPIHVRSKTTGRIMTIDERPGFWLDARGQDRPEWTPDRKPPGTNHVRLTPDLAHQGSFAYIPYLVTGDYYYLEEAYFWANYCLLATWDHPRRQAEGILSGQIRGNAWALRNLADAATIAPDGGPEGKYFDEKVRNNIADRIRRMYGPPEHSKLGFWGERTTESARIQKPANPDWMVVAPWEHDYLIWSFHHLVELGYAQAAKPRDYLLRWRVGLLTSQEFDPRMAAPYRLVVGERTPDGGVRFYDDWKQLARENKRLYKPDLATCGCCYPYSARAALVCGVDAAFPKAREAQQTLESLLLDHRQVMAREPFWAIAPGGAACSH